MFETLGICMRWLHIASVATLVGGMLYGWLVLVPADAVLAVDARKALPTGVHSTLDAIRNFGNFSAHPITDQTTLQIIDVEDHEAEYCLDILDALFDHYYVRPADAKRKRAALDAKLKAAGKPPTCQLKSPVLI